MTTSNSTSQKRSLSCCNDCGAAPGALHVEGCDVERCARCGHQRIGCECVYIVNGLDPDTLETDHPEIYTEGATDAMMDKFGAECPRLPWTGEWPGVAECREFGWYSKFNEGTGWLVCDKDDPGATEDLNRLATRAVWDPESKRYHRRT